MRLAQRIALGKRQLRAVLVCATFISQAHAQQQSSAPSQQPASGAYEDLRVLASRLLKYSDSADCHKGSCKLLVASFRLPDNHGSVYGRELADDLASELTSQAPEIQVIDRALLKGYLEKERIPSERLHESEYRAIGADLHATSVLIGTTSRFDDNAIQLSARMLSVEEADHIGNSAEVNLLAPVSSVDLSPSDSYASFSPRLQSSNREDLYPAGVNGVGLPSCTYMPNPPYSEVARKFRVNGSLIVEAVVTAEGKLHDFRIVRGLPGGLNENTLATLKTWRCSPPLRNGKPVPVAVPFEVNFRLY